MWLAGLLSTIAVHAAPPSGTLADAFVGADGRYVMARFAGGNTAIWDLDRLYDPIQPSLVHYFGTSGLEFVGWEGGCAFTSHPGRFYGPASVVLIAFGEDLPVVRTAETAITHERDLCVSADGRAAIVLGDDKFVVIQWDEQGDATLRTIDDVGDRVTPAWERDVAAVADFDSNSVSLRTLSTLDVVGKQQLPGPILSIRFSPDLSTLVACVGAESGEPRVMYLPVRSEGANVTLEPPLEKTTHGYVAPAEEGAPLWHVSPFEDTAMLRVAGPDGRPDETTEAIEIPIGERGEGVVTAISSSRGYAVVAYHTENSLCLVNLKEGLPEFDLYASPMGYIGNTGLFRPPALRRRGGPMERDPDELTLMDIDDIRVDSKPAIPHLPARLGSHPALGRLLQLAQRHDDGDPRFSATPHELVFAVSIAGRLRLRSDAAWHAVFDRSALDSEWASQSEYLGLLIRAIGDLSTAERLARADKPEQALALAREALQIIETSGAAAYESAKEDPERRALIEFGLKVVEADLWRTAGACALRTGQAPDRCIDAIQAAIEINPVDWRAYSAVLDIMRGNAKEAELEAFLKEAQGALQLHSGFGEAGQLGFFHERSIWDFRNFLNEHAAPARP